MSTTISPAATTLANKLVDATLRSGRLDVVADAEHRAVELARAAGVTDDDLSWYGQYGRPEQAPYYRAGRRQARAIERRLIAAGVGPAGLKALNYTSGWPR